MGKGRRVWAKPSFTLSEASPLFSRGDVQGPGKPQPASTCKVKNLCPLFADVDLDICTPKCQVGTTLVKDQ